MLTETALNHHMHYPRKPKVSLLCRQGHHERCVSLNCCCKESNCPCRLNILEKK